VFGRLLKKEIKELLSVGTIVFVVIVSVLYGSLGNVFEGTIKEVTKKPKIAIVEHDRGELAKFVVQELSRAAEIVYAGDDLDEAKKTLEEKKASAIFLIPEGFSSDLESFKQTRIEVLWYLRGTGLSDTIPTAAVYSLLENLKTRISAFLLRDEKKTRFLISPFTVVQHTYLRNMFFENRSPDSIVNIFYSQNITIPLLIMILIIMSGSSLISSLALEKENKTLETLLTMPIRREYIVLAKIVGSAIVGLILAGIYMIGFYSYLNSFSQGIQRTVVSFSIIDFALIGLSLLLAILAGLSLCMFFGIMAKDYRSSQFFTFPISILALVPMIANMIKDFSNLPGVLKVIIFTIPFSHPIMAPKMVLYGDYGLIVWGLVYLIGFSLAMMWLAFRTFNSDYAILGWQGKRSR